MIQKAAAKGNWWLAASSWQHACSCITSHAKFFAKHQITQVTQTLYSPDLVPCNFWLFPKTNITFEKEQISDHQWNSGKYNSAADGDWENCVRSQGACFEGNWCIFVLCTVFLVSCIFFNKYLFFILRGWLPSGQALYIIPFKPKEISSYDRKCTCVVTCIAGTPHQVWGREDSSEEVTS